MGKTHVSKLKGLFEVSATHPTNPQTGDRFFNTTKGTLEYYTGTGWIESQYTSTSTSTSSTSTTTTSSSTTTSTTTSTSTTTTSTSTTL